MERHSRKGAGVVEGVESIPKRDLRCVAQLSPSYWIVMLENAPNKSASVGGSIPSSPWRPGVPGVRTEDPPLCCECGSRGDGGGGC